MRIHMGPEDEFGFFYLFKNEAIKREAAEKVVGLPDVSATALRMIEG